MEDRRVAKSKNHNLILENRGKLSISGVEHVDSFNENTVLIETVQGVITVKGTELNISKLNLEDGNVVIEGHVYSLIYSDRESLQNKGGGFLGKMFK